MPKAGTAAERALTIDPQQPDGHVVLGLVRLLYDWNWDESRRELTLSSTLRPQVVETFTCAAHLLETTGRGPEAEREIRQALVDNPLSVSLNTELGSIVLSGDGINRRSRSSVARYSSTATIRSHTGAWGEPTRNSKITSERLRSSSVSKRAPAARRR